MLVWEITLKYIRKFQILKSSMKKSKTRYMLTAGRSERTSLRRW